MSGFELLTPVLYGKEEGVIAGKRYGDRLNMFAGRIYDIWVWRGTYRCVLHGIRENDLKEKLDEDVDAPFSGGQQFSVPRLVKNDDK